MNYFRTILIGMLALVFSCKEKTSDTNVSPIGSVACQVQPYYLSQTGLNPKASALSTSEKNTMGLVLIEYLQDGNSFTRGKSWQHESWNKHGWLGPITTDDNGNSYVAPVPVISVLDNPIQDQNTVYKVDSRTAEMKPLVILPAADTSPAGNPYGLLGLYFDCATKVLYASSVAGSDRDHEKGVIYAIDPVTGKIIDRLEGIDAIGLCVSGVTGENKLYIGSSRSSTIYTVAINSKGEFDGKPQQDFSLDMIGPRGDDKARRIRFDKNGLLQINGIEFNYNLTAASEKQETIYYFKYDPAIKKWVPS